MKRILLIIAILGLIPSLKAQTTIEDNTEVSGTWTKAGSPYIIQGKAEIPNNDTLIIEPGVAVQFKTGTKLNETDYDVGWIRCRGYIIAEGDINDSIIFTRSGPDGYWGGIQTSKFDFSYCKFEYGSGIGYSFEGLGTLQLINQIDSVYAINNNLFIENLNAGISLISQNSLDQSNIFNNAFIRNTQGINLRHTGSKQNPVLIESCLFDENKNAVYNQNSSGTELYLINSLFYKNEGNYWLFSNAIFINSIICENTGEQYTSPNADVSYTNCIFKYSPVIESGKNIFYEDLKFDNPETFDFNLPSNSLANNNGNSNFIDGYVFKTNDYNGNPRIKNEAIDIGPIELQNDYIRFEQQPKQAIFKKGLNIPIQWSTSLSNTKIELSKNAGVSWEDLSIETDTFFTWNVPNESINSGLLKISSPTNPSISDTLFFSTSDSTTIADSAFVYGTWTKEMSPIVVLGEAIVPLGKTLTIKPGVHVIFKTGTNLNIDSNDFDAGRLLVLGQIYSEGNENDTIYFSRLGNEGYWGQIEITPGLSDNEIFNYCSFQYTADISTIWGYSSALLIRRDNVNVNNCVFNNLDSDCGLFLRECSSEIKKCLFKNIKGGIYASGFHSIIQNCEFNNCGRAAYFWYWSKGMFENNSVSNSNGIEFAAGSSTVVQNNFFKNNTQALRVGEAEPTFFNNIFCENETAVILSKSWTPLFSNNLFYNNKLAVKNYLNAPGKFVNTIYYQNEKDLDLGSEIEILNCFFTNDSVSTYLSGEENVIALNPMFADTANLNFTPLTGSPLIDAGILDTTGLTLPETDYINNTRISNGRIDIGPYEFQNNNEYVRITEPYFHKYMVSFLTDTLRWTLSDSSSFVNLKYSTDNGKSWQTIAENEPNDGEFIWTVPELISDSCLLAITDKNTPAIADTSNYFFTISPNQIPDGKMVYGIWFEKYSPYYVMGHATINQGDSLTIEPGVILKMKAYDPSLNIWWDEYKTDYRGILNNNGYLQSIGTAEKPIIFTRDSDTEEWGGIYFNQNCDDSSVLKNCIIEYGKETDLISRWAYTTGIVYCYGSSPTIENCIIRNNVGSGIWTEYGSNPILKNNTIVNNSGYGIGNLSNIKISNSILVSNKEGSFYSSSKIDSLRYCLVEGDNNFVNEFSIQSGNLFNQNPQFINAANGNYRLRPNSPCIDTGDPNDDFSLEPDPNGGRINMGAYGNTPWAASFQPLPRIDQLSISEGTVLGFDTLSISGKHFLEAQGNGEIWFDAAEAHEYLYWSEDSLVCIVPPHASDTVSITIKNNDSLESEYERIFTYNNPVIEDIQPISSLPAGNIPVTITGSGFGNSLNSTQLFFGLNEAVEYLYWSNDSIVITCPASEEGFVALNFETINNIGIQFPESFLSSSSGITKVCGTISGTWKAGQTYILTCPVEIPEDSILTIEEGVTVIAKLNSENKVSLTNNGTLTISGTSNNPVKFKSLPAMAGNWEGIILNSPGQIYNVTISYAENGIDIRTSDAIIDHATIRNCSENGIYLNGDEHSATAIIANCTLSDNSGYGIKVNAVASEYRGTAGGAISENLIFGNSEGGIAVTASGYAPWSTSTRSSTAYASPEIEKNRIYENQGPGIYCSSYGDQEEALQGGYITRGGTANPEIYQNLVYNNESGLVTYQGSEYAKTEISAVNNVFYANGIDVNQGTVLFHNNIVWGDNSVIDNNGLFETKYSLLPKLSIGNGNISQDPLFISPENGDFTLQSTSPCIDAGSNEFVDFETDFDGKIRIISGTVDIGAYEFNSYYVGIIKHELSAVINVYPNPSKGKIQIDGLPRNEQVVISVFNISGKIISQMKNFGKTAIIDITNEKPGIYLVKIDGKTRHTAKIIKE